MTRRSAGATETAVPAAPAPRGENMKSTAQKRLARLAGLVVLSLLVIAVGAQVVRAAAVAGAEGRGGAALLTTTPPAESGRGGFGLVAATPVAGTQGRGGIAAVPLAPATGTEPISSGTSYTVAWILIGSAVAVLMLGLAAWALVSRRRQRSEPLSVAFCARHPEHAMCGTA